MTVELSIRARSRSRLRRTNIFSLVRPPRLTMHQVRPRRQWLHRTTSSIRRIATSASQSLHCYSGRLKRSAIFMIVNDRASLFSFLRREVGAHISEGARSPHKHVGRRRPAATFRPDQRRRQKVKKSIPFSLNSLKLIVVLRESCRLKRFSHSAD